MQQNHEAETGSEWLLAGLVTQHMLAEPCANTAKQGGAKQDAFGRSPGSRPGRPFVQPEPQQGMEIAEGQKDQEQIDPARDFQCA